MDKKIITFNRGVPPVESFPTKDLIESAVNALETDGNTILQYGKANGYPPLLDLLAEDYSTDQDHIVIGNGSLQLLDMLIRSAGIPQPRIYVEQPTYDRPLTIFRRAGAILKGFLLADGRLNFDEIKQTLDQGKYPNYFYVIPDFQNPSGAVMPLADRQKLVGLAVEHQFILIEDATYRELRYSGDALPSLYELDPENTIHMMSYSKLISPGLRVGFMVGNALQIEKLNEYAGNTYISSAFLSQAVVNRFIQQGMLEKQVDDLKNLYSGKLELLLSRLDAELTQYADWIKPEGGFFVGMYLKDGFKLAPQADCLAAGLSLFDSTKFFLTGGSEFIRLPFCALDDDEIVTAVSLLKSLIIRY